MRNRSYTFTFNLFLFLLALAAASIPLVLGELLLVPRFSSLHSQMKLIYPAIEKSITRNYLLLGDSTVRNLHPNPESIELDHDIINLSMGGSVSDEWYYAMRNAFRAGARFKAVIAGMSTGESLESKNLIPPYSPILLDSADVFEEFRSGRLSIRQSALLLLYAHLHLVTTRSDVLSAVVVHFLPEMRGFMMDLALHQMENSNPEVREVYGAVEKIRFEGLKKLIDLAEKNSSSFRLVLSPAAEFSRNEKQYLAARSLFLETCDRFRLKCTNLSESFPDRFFSEDGIHLKAEYKDEYKRKIEALFIEDNRHE